MSEIANTSAAGSSSAPAASTVTPAAAAPSAAELRTAASTLSVSEMDGMLDDKPSAAPAVETAAAPVAPAATPAAAPAAPVEESDGNDPLESIKGIKIKPNDYREQEVFRLMKPKNGERALTLQEAVAKVYPQAAVTTEAAKPTTTEASPEPAKADSDSRTEAINSDIKKLEAAIDAAAEDMNAKEVAKLSRELSRKERELERITEQKDSAEKAKQAEAEASVNNTFRQKQLSARDELVAKFPVLGDKTSTERQEFDQWLGLKQGDPDYESVFASPRWPLILGREFAEAKGLSGTARPAQSPAANPNAAQVAQRATAASVITPGGNSGQQFQPTVESLRKDITTMTTKDLDSLLS